jgi:hypothetical protein
MEERKLTYGEKLVGLTFNPGGDPKVTRAKELFAEAADLLAEAYREKNLGHSSLTEALYGHAIGEVLNAQMNVVKILTFPKY